MKFNIKSKLGFTLIELLVVIGILAVLAAIAIPSVAGLIDRANVSADATNANEMTNAVERFTSEYELYCQDIASGRVKAGDLDSAQGRVFNVTGADSREDIELLESTGLNGRQIYRDTKYPANAETMQSLVENYMKTSSTTFTPKQSDCHYYYSPDCGVVVCTETAKSSTTDLNKLIQSGKDAKGNTLGAETQWIDLTNSISIDNENNSNLLNHSGTIPEGGTYYDGKTFCENCGANLRFEAIDSCYCGQINSFRKLNSGDVFPTPETGDIYVFDGYQYVYNCYFPPIGNEIEEYGDGWGVQLIDKNTTVCNQVLENIANCPVTNMTNCYAYSTITSAPAFHSNITNVSYAFYGCDSLTGTIFIDITHLEEYEGLFSAIDFQKQQITLSGLCDDVILDAMGCDYSFCPYCNGYCSCGYIELCERCNACYIYRGSSCPLCD